MIGLHNERENWLDKKKRVVKFRVIQFVLKRKQMHKI